MRKVLSGLFLLMGISVNILAQQKQFIQPGGNEIKIDNIDKLVTDLMDSNRVTGLCLGMVNDNLPVYIQAYGYRDKEKNEKNDTATIFYAASLAKPLFAYIVMHLVDE